MGTTLMVDRCWGGQNTLGEVFEVYLVNNANARLHNFERIEGLHAPLEEFR